MIDILLVCSLLISFSACSSGIVVNEGFDITDYMTDSPVHGMDSAIEALEALDYGVRVRQNSPTDLS